jgi:protein-S-isoprenylcysteine O-methyltransferase Ste14
VRLRIPPLLVTALTLILIWAIARILPGLSMKIPLRLWLASALTLAGSVVTVWAVASFQSARTTVNPLIPDAASRLLVSGIYRHSRNPMYLGMLLVVAGWTLYQANAAAALMLPGFVAYLKRFQIEPEEEILKRKFGTEYEEYFNRVRRWL